MLQAGLHEPLLEWLAGAPAAIDEFRCGVVHWKAAALNRSGDYASAETVAADAVACDPHAGAPRLELADALTRQLREEHTDRASIAADRELIERALLVLSEVPPGSELASAAAARRDRLETSRRQLEEIDRSIDETERNEELAQIRRRCSELLWQQRTRTLSDDERAYFDAHTCRRFALK